MSKFQRIKIASPDCARAAEIMPVQSTPKLYFQARCGILGTALLGHLCCPGDLLFFELPAHVPESAKRPDTSPDERCGPANDIAGLSVDGENQDSTESGHCHGTNTPEETETTEHGAEDMAGFVAAVQGFAVLGASATVDTDDVFDHGVNTRTELGAFGNTGDTAWCGDLEVAADVD